MIVFIVILIGFIVGICGAFYDIYDRHRLEKAIKIEQKNNLIQAEKLRQEKRISIETELNSLYDEMALLNRLFVLENINKKMNSEDKKDVKTALAMVKKQNILDKKIDRLQQQLESL